MVRSLTRSEEAVAKVGGTAGERTGSRCNLNGKESVSRIEAHMQRATEVGFPVVRTSRLESKTAERYTG
jgi:hypothetical protein